MRVLLTNDDGGPNDATSAYIKYLVEAITKYTDWNLTICVPSSQKSWIGKAHFAGREVTATYIYSAIDKPFDNSFHGPFSKPNSGYLEDPNMKEWCLIDGTPATCADIGLHYIAQEPIDLVLSGPNVGRNSSATYALSSGTIGGAMEGCHMGKRAIALSYAYDKDCVTDPKLLREASLIAVKLIENLYGNWDPQAELYTLNIPLVDSLKLGKTKIYKTPILENQWSASLYQPLETDSSAGTDIVDASSGAGQKFKWSPDFASVHRAVAASEGQTDGKVISQGHISVTALRAVFKQVDSFNSGEMVLQPFESTNVVITYPPGSYIFEPLESSLAAFLKGCTVYNNLEQAGDGKVFQYGEYEDLDHERMMTDRNYMANSYIYRKALIRKHYLSNTVAVYSSKNPSSALAKSFPVSYQLELDYAEFLDDSLDESYELRCELENNEHSLAKTFILKPSMSDKGQGIRIFQTIDQLQQIFDSFEENYNSDDEEADDEANNGVISSQLRHFVVQEYVDKPLLLAQYDNRKFHIRTYVLCVGDLKVYVYQRMLMLFSETPYQPPQALDIHNMAGHLTNTCLQGETDKMVVTELAQSCLETETQQQIRDSINTVVSDLFKAASSVDKINFQPLPNAFEVFGLDFLVDSELNITLLEVNSYPDFKQTGDELKGLIFELFDGVVATAVAPFFGKSAQEVENLQKVLDVEGRH